MAITEPPTSGHSVRAPRVLVVDDDPFVLRAVRRLLLGRRQGWEIDIAERADAAFRLLETKTYDVVVTDIHMPELNGVALLQRLKSERPCVMRVIHSSHVEPLTGPELEALAHAVVAKPDGAEKLVEVLKRAIAQRGEPGIEACG